MRKNDIIMAIAAQTGIPKVDVLVVIEGFFTEVKTAVTRGETVSLRRFGTFASRKRAGRQARNISKGEDLFVPEHYIPKFLPSGEFMDAVKNSTSTE